MQQDEGKRCIENDLRGVRNDVILTIHPCQEGLRSALSKRLLALQGET
jgi:hypothetical protein